MNFDARGTACHNTACTMLEQQSLFAALEAPPSVVTDSDGLTREDRFERFEEWVRTVRDPAKEASEGVRRLQTRNGKAYAEYEIAPLPDGGFAILVNCGYKTGDCSGMGSPWHDFDTREECLAYFLRLARSHFGHDGRVKGLQSEMLTLLRDTLCGFVEPEPIN